MEALVQSVMEGGGDSLVGSKLGGTAREGESEVEGMGHH